jgi:exonuclease SbcC
MPVRVRVQNFQSIKDATVVIDGLTVVTGPNNSGKTAVMRAVRGVFTNAPAGPLVRHGAGYLSVTLTFDDGTEVIWEKGWEKPNRKGKTVNRYFLNGKELQSVGRGVPPEIADLGVREIRASSDRVWPQVAQQFDGTLFLINRPGAAVAEALSDVEKVGRLTKALRFSEKDKRTVTDELRVRRKDLKDAKDEVAAYDGLDAVSETVAGLSEADLLQPWSRLTEAVTLRGRHESAKSAVDALEGFDPDVVPSSKKAVDLQAQLGPLVALQKRLKTAREAVDALEGFDPDVVPDEHARPKKLQNLISQLEVLRHRYQSESSAVDALEGFEIPDFPDDRKAERMGMLIEQIEALQRRHEKAKKLVRDLEDEEATAIGTADEAALAVQDALGANGFCPTCNTVHEGLHE